MSKKSKALVYFIAFVLIVGVAGVSGAFYVYRALFIPNARAEQESVFEIRPGENLGSVAERLQEGGYIRSSVVFELYARYRGLDRRLQAGRYLISDRLGGAEILEKISTGDAVFDEIIVTIPEGWSANDIETHLEELGLFAREEFAEAVVMQPSYRDFAFLEPLEDDTILDGYLFPDTYRVFADSSPESVVRRMLLNFDRRLTEDIRREIARQNRTLHDVLTLASIVQAESPIDDMPSVAGVFWNRLEINMPLESDATVNYVLGTKKLQPTFADTRVDNPYNTYRRPGLPPGPIGNPGLDAIRATLDPDEHDYFFFLHKPTRETVFSRTFAEHLAAKARYLD